MFAAGETANLYGTDGEQDEGESSQTPKWNKKSALGQQIRFKVVEGRIGQVIE